MQDGVNFLTSVKYVRVKVDNEFKIIRADGSILNHTKLGTKQLNAIEVRPRLQEEYKCPDVSQLKKPKKEEDSGKKAKI